MRITNSMMVQDMLWYANKNLSAMSTYQNQLSSGLRVQDPSDDPVGVTKILKYKTDINVAQQFQENVGDALSWLQVSETALNDVKEVLQRVRELTVQAANGTNTDEDNSKIAIEIEELTEELISLGNSTVTGKYIFSGYETDEALFNSDGTFNIDMTSKRYEESESISLEVSIGETMEVATSASDVFGVVSDNSFFESLITWGSSESTESTHTSWKTTLDLENDYSSDTLNFTIDGDVYTVDSSTLIGTANTPITKSDFISAINNADFSGTKLSDVANVYFDNNGQLVVEAEAFGSATTITGGASSGYTGTTSVSGVDALDGTFLTTGIVTDAAVSAYSDTSTLVVEIDGIQKKIELDFSSITTVADLTTAIQSELDTAFSPAGTVTVSGSDGTALSFSVSGTNDGQTHEIGVDYIYASESQLILDMQNLAIAMRTGDQSTIETSLSLVDDHMDNVLTEMGEIGGKTNRAEFILSRLEDNELTYTELLSGVQDIDYSEAILMYKSLESIYRASLSVGAQVIQPSLVDFIS